MALTSPYAELNARVTPGITRKHVELIWENMLGTVSARNPQTGEEKYFDYDWEGARKFAQVEKCNDLRLCRKDLGGPTYISPGGKLSRRKDRLRLYGIFEGWE